MKTTTYLLNSLAWLLVVHLCGAASPGDYTVTVNPRVATVIVGEPVILTATFSNLTAETVSLAWASGTPGYDRPVSKGSIQISTNGTVFQDVSAFEQSGARILPYGIPPRGSVGEAFTLLSDKNGNLLCPKAGQYWMRARMKILKDDESYWVVSDVAQVTVVAPRGDDLVAWKLLEANPLYLDLVRSPSSLELSESDRQGFDGILQSHSQSAYAPYVALSLGRQAFEGQTRTRPVDLPRAKTYLSTALALTKSPALRKLASSGIEQVQRLEQRQLQKQKDSPKQLVTNLIFKATTELEAQWYDVKGFMRSTNWVARQFRSKAVELSWKYRHSEMTGDEFDRTYADLLQENITKNLKPLDPEEWRRRKSEYAKEDEARAKAEAERMRKLKEETDPPSGPAREP